MKKDEQIRMLLHPEDYTDEQLDQMLEEAHINVPDANEAWERFKNERQETRHVKLPLMKIAAIFVGVLMLSGITYAAIHFIDGSSQKAQEPQTVITDSAQRPATEAQPTDNNSTELKTVVYEDTELATILNDIAKFYQVEPVYKKEDTKHIRLYFTWDKQLKLDDVIEMFNKFERFHITQENQKLIVE